VTWVYRLDHPHAGSAEEVTALIGGKAANLGVMARELGLPVPPGIAITTAACTEYLATGWPRGLDDEIRSGVREIEDAVGRRFGDPADPLLLSVRSGAPVSMPGMMDTILDLGLNGATARGLAQVTGDPSFARDCHVRFRRMFRDITGVEAPDDPWLQLRLAIEAVFRSWNGDRARAYRRREGIPDDLGTGVTVQAMVFGNRGADSATGVVFTRNPATGEPGLYGDVMFGAQGEDVVAGTHPTQPLSVLDERLPAVGRELREHGARLERHYRDLCDIEFTIEQGRLWLLQVRIGKRSPRAALRIALDMAEDDTFPLSRRDAVLRVAQILARPPMVPTGRPADLRPLTVGLGASPGVATGEIVTRPEDAERIADEGRRPVLVRAETSPDDVHGMARAVGILTTLGGLASHAAVVARGWGIPAVVGARDVRVLDGEVRFPGASLRTGDSITVDGDTGEVFAGAVPAAMEIASEAATLLEWARELGIPIGTLPDATSEERGSGAGPGTRPASEAGPWPGATPEACLHVLRLKGVASADAIRHATGATPDALERPLAELARDGLVERIAGAYRLTEDGRSRAAALLAREREAVGLAQATAALDGFLDLDRRVKAAVTDWQLRPSEGGPVVNGHADPAYDAAVLARLADCHQAAIAWIAPLEDTWPRARGYRTRLASALERALAGDQRYVASPRVDSYHGIWFELHEDLIGLAGRTRADEVAAGRA